MYGSWFVDAVNWVLADPVRIPWGDSAAATTTGTVAGSSGKLFSGSKIAIVVAVPVVVIWLRYSL